MNDLAVPAKLFDLKNKRIFVAGHRGMVGSAIARRLARSECSVLTAGRDNVDLLKQDATERFLADMRPQVVIVAAAKVGGIHANDTFPAEFIYENLAIATNVIHGAYLAKVEKLLFLGSSCIYPRLARQPISEEELLTGPLEPTNEWYAIAKIAGVKLCQAYRRQYGADFVSVMPTNVFGPGDNYHPENSHVIAALIRRFHEAKIAAAPTVTVWGTGKPRREFIYVDDLAEACVFVLERYSGEFTSQYRDRQGRHDCRTGATHCGSRGLSWRTCLRHHAAGWHTAQALRRVEAGSTRLERTHPLRLGLERAYSDFVAGGGRDR